MIRYVWIEHKYSSDLILFSVVHKARIWPCYVWQQRDQETGSVDSSGSCGPGHCPSRSPCHWISFLFIFFNCPLETTTWQLSLFFDHCYVCMVTNHVVRRCMRRLQPGIHRKQKKKRKVKSSYIFKEATSSSSRDVWDVFTRVNIQYTIHLWVFHRKLLSWGCKPCPPTSFFTIFAFKRLLEFEHTFVSIWNKNRFIFVCVNDCSRRIADTSWVWDLPHANI